MFQSNFYIPTSKNNVKDAKVVSHELLIKAGYAYQHAAGLYTYLPLATRVLNNIEKVVKEEIDKIGGCELKLPFLQPSELWKESGRWQGYGDELFRVNDRHGREFALAPTHEEIASDVVRDYLNSYKKYPLNIYQIQTKMRDERRPRFGLLRSREFIMFDGYTFNEDNDSLNKDYDKYYDAYKRILDRFELDYKIVEADNGSMGGSRSHEFMVLSEIGEDTICYEEGNDIAFNVEAAKIFNNYEISSEEEKTIEKISTPDSKTIEKVSKFLNVNTEKTLKAIALDVNDQLVIAFIRGDREIQDVKLARYLNVEDIEFASEELLKRHGVVAGYIGLVNLDDKVRVILDREVTFMKNFVCGANEEEQHYINVNLTNDMNYEVADIRTVVEGDLIRENGKGAKLTKGIEVGHIFALGDKYTKSMNITYLDQNQKEVTPLMGCYGIGISRILSSYIEQKHIEKRIKFNKEITPFDYHLIPLDYQKNEEQKEFTLELKELLESKGYSVLVDDRNERVGSKLNDAELIGCNRQIIIGRNFKDGKLEEMTFGKKIEINIEDLRR